MIHEYTKHYWRICGTRQRYNLLINFIVSLKHRGLLNKSNLKAVRATFVYAENLDKRNLHKLTDLMTNSTQITYPKETFGVFSHAVTLYLNKEHVCN